MFLGSLFLTGVLLAVVFQARNVELFTGPLGTLFVDGQSHPLLLGIVPLRVLLLTGSLLCTLWIAEIFGARIALFVCCTAGFSLVLVWAALQVIPFLPTSPAQLQQDATHGTIFGTDLTVFASIASQVSLGFSFVAIVYALLRKLTRNRFHLIRLMMVIFLGLSAPPLLEAFFDSLFLVPHGQLMAVVLTRYFQWLALLLVLIPFYYLMEIFWQVMAGSQQIEMVRQYYAPARMSIPITAEFFEDRGELQDKRMFPHPAEKFDPENSEQN